MLMTWQDAICAAQRRINERAKAVGLDSPLTGHDLAVIAAHEVGERTFNATRAKHGDNPEFNEQAVAYATKLIAQALLTGQGVGV